MERADLFWTLKQFYGSDILPGELASELAGELAGEGEGEGEGEVEGEGEGPSLYYHPLRLCHFTHLATPPPNHLTT